jgi:leucyl/phenylalanyl-tRNA--protein transferase
MAARRGPEITAEVLLRAYAVGIFPMAESADDTGLHWIEPELRGVLPIETFHVPKRLARTVKSDKFEVRIDSDFDAVISACAAPAKGRRKTWINARIRRLYGDLHLAGHCHSVETWFDGELVGGLYGLKLGAAFFGESMFSRATDASKVALVHLVARLRAGGYRLLDTQFITDHLTQFGAIEIPRATYQIALESALQEPGGTFSIWPKMGVTGEQALAALNEGAERLASRRTTD